jgi:Zn-dependent protease with chaperone function
LSDSWRGRYVDGRTAVVRDVALNARDGALIGRVLDALDADVELFHWPRAALTFEILEPGVVTIRSRDSPDAAVTVTTVNAEAMRQLGCAAPATTRIGRRGRALMFGVGAVALAGTFYACLTPIARAVANHVPPAIEADLGQGLSALLATQYCDTKAARTALSHLAVRLGASPRMELHVLESDSDNAFTFPGGVVIVTRGLIDHAHGPDEVAGVLAHELEHVRLRHVTIRFVRGSLMTVLWQASVGDYTGMLAVDPKTAFDLANLRFSRDDERAADQGALDRLAAAHVSSKGLQDFFERLAPKTGAAPAWLSSHPASAERLGHIRRAGAGPTNSVQAALSAADWNALKQGCARTK